MAIVSTFHEQTVIQSRLDEYEAAVEASERSRNKARTLSATLDDLKKQIADAEEDATMHSSYADALNRRLIRDGIVDAPQPTERYPDKWLSEDEARKQNALLKAQEQLAPQKADELSKLLNK